MFGKRKKKPVEGVYLVMSAPGVECSIGPYDSDREALEDIERQRTAFLSRSLLDVMDEMGSGWERRLSKISLRSDGIMYPGAVRYVNEFQVFGSMWLTPRVCYYSAKQADWNVFVDWSNLFDGALMGWYLEYLGADLQITIRRSDEIRRDSTA